THCYDEQPLDICTPYNANDTEKVREQINCTNYDVNYKVLALTVALDASVAATLPEEDRNQSYGVTEFIVQWCSSGYALPRHLYNYTCEEYLAMVPVTCDAPVTLSVPDVNGLGKCAQRNKIANLCMEGDSLTEFLADRCSKLETDAVQAITTNFPSLRILAIEYHRANDVGEHSTLSRCLSE
ncbi:hypothetical protein MRX96_053171, partial [Rhipicephalus microplus]